MDTPARRLRLSDSPPRGCAVQTDPPTTPMGADLSFPRGQSKANLRREWKQLRPGTQEPSLPGCTKDRKRRIGRAGACPSRKSSLPPSSSNGSSTQTLAVAAVGPCPRGAFARHGGRVRATFVRGPLSLKDARLACCGGASAHDGSVKLDHSPSTYLTLMSVSGRLPRFHSPLAHSGRLATARVHQPG